MTTQDSKSAWKDMTFLQKCKHIKKNTTVEPTLAFYVMPSILSGLATQNLFLEKACRTNLEYGEEVCDALTARNTANYTVEERAVQSLVASLQGWKTVFQSLLPCLIILFWGSWSDRHQRRKPCMLVPIVGELLAQISLIINYYFKSWPMEVAGISEVIFPGLSGGWFLLFMGVFSYTADITSQEERTFRIGVVNVFFTISIPVGMAFSGILLKRIGFYGVFATSATFLLANLFYTLFLIEEPARKVQEPQRDSQKSLLADFFDTAHVANTFKVAFKKGENKRRLKVILVLVVCMLIIGPLHGEIAVTYLFTRYKFNWSEVEYSIFSTYSMVLQLIGTMFAVTILSRKLKISDGFIGVLASSSKILSSFMYAFAATGRQLFIGPIIEFLKETAFISLRSIASKLVKNDELGKVNSLIGIAEGLMPLIYAPMYTQVYQATLDVFPGAFYLLGGALTLPAVFIFLWLYKLQKNDNHETNNEKIPEEFSLMSQSMTELKEISRI